jgi:hypothetical protein
MEVQDLHGRDGLIFVSDSQEVRTVKEHLPRHAQDYDSYFVAVDEGEYTEVYGMFGTVPYIAKEVYPVDLSPDILRLVNSKGREVFRAYYNGIVHDGTRLIDFEQENGSGFSHGQPVDVFDVALCCWIDNPSCSVTGTSRADFLKHCKTVRASWLTQQIKNRLEV